MPGITAYTASYNTYRVERMVLRLTVTNTSSTKASMLYVWPSSTLWTANTLTQGNIVSYGGNPGGKKIQIPPNTSTGAIELHCVATGIIMFGPPFEYGDNYCGLAFNANPAKPFGINLGFFNCDATEASLNITASIALETVFFDLLQPDD